ncbi:sodium:proton antiporter [Pseudoclavibacter chungangensis]|uniref:Sodium:proton antiporter n=1 Tax=Pseudoclavibacter chungangensis TaxID=587635 RepID=A0A7J5C148_9MICO|nr:monovalent cation/H+ antiporter complex subunit F [Pseudoclavibacter chungangensis]KAB1659530.1 sodium:proton antiporter [Pseudoclavibacter chungangensis]NYJ67607.1 multisubunit Na+/H+ antiporter MnhF subunit [Pseudoclavibacter chungangensis]
MSEYWTVIAWIVGLAFAIGAALALVRMITGPTIVDRMVASDTLLTVVICVLGAEMVVNGDTTLLPLMLALAMTAFIASVTVARYVSRQGGRATPEVAPSGDQVSGVCEPVDTIGALERAEESVVDDADTNTTDGGGR